MTISQALNKVSNLYIPGAAGYYGQINPDPWQMAHDDFERAISSSRDPDILSLSCHRFVNRTQELIERFKIDGKTSSIPSPLDAFILADPHRVDAHISRKTKRCFSCNTKEGLKIIPVSEGSLDVMLSCNPCEIKLNKKALSDD